MRLLCNSICWLIYAVGRHGADKTLQMSQSVSCESRYFRQAQLNLKIDKKDVQNVSISIRCFRIKQRS